MDHDAGGGDAVHVIVPIDGDLDPLVDGPADLRRGLVHILQQKGIVDALHRLGHEVQGLFPGVQAPGRENTGCKPAEPKLAGQLFRTGIMIGCKQPFFLLHFPLQMIFLLGPL